MEQNLFFSENFEEGGAPIEFHTEDIEFELNDVIRISNWIIAVIQAEGKRLQHISYIFCSDNYLLDLNEQYLNHDTLTDIITFHYSKPPSIEGDIFISIERVRENAQIYRVAFEQELYRVIIHGVLHLCGYSDKTPADKARMTEKENEALLKLHSM
jgi:probable rRNA maturation factor